MGAPEPVETPGKGRILLRGLVKHCPRCGEHPIFTSWTEMMETCPRCGLVYEQEEGYWVGSLTINTVVTLFGFGLAILVAAIATWPDSPVLLLIVAGIVGGIIFPIFFFPFSRTLWVALDLAFFNPQRMRPGSGLRKYR